MYTTRTLIIFGLAFFTTTHLFSMDRVAQNKQALLEKWRGKEEKMINAINRAYQTGKSQQLIAGERGELAATFLPLQRQVVLVGPGYETTRVEFDYFVRQINVLNGQKKNTQINNERRCVLQ